MPYPDDAVREVRWQINYSFARRVGSKVAFYPKPRAQVARQVFDIELENFGTSGKPNWRVSDWIPSGGPQVSAAAPRARSGNGAPLVQTGGEKTGIGSIWLLVPVVLIGGSLLLLVGALGVRGWIRQSRANRAYSKSL